jgi:hypothetical protein
MQTKDDLTARVASLEARVRGSRRLLSLVLVAVVVAWSLQGGAQDDWAPPGFHVFSPNTPAVASEVNDNFRWLVERVGDGMPVGSAGRCSGRDVRRTGLSDHVSYNTGLKGAQCLKNAGRVIIVISVASTAPGSICGRRRAPGKTKLF